MLTPLALDDRLPADTLFMVFEEDFRFFEEGQDPESDDGYSGRVVKKVVDRGFATLSEAESLPPQSPSPQSPPPRTSGKGGKPKPESRFFDWFARLVGQEG